MGRFGSLSKTAQTHHYRENNEQTKTAVCRQLTFSTMLTMSSRMASRMKMDSKNCPIDRPIHRLLSHRRDNPFRQLPINRSVLAFSSSSKKSKKFKSPIQVKAARQVVKSSWSKRAQIFTLSSRRLPPHPRRFNLPCELRPALLSQRSREWFGTRRTM